MDEMYENAQQAKHRFFEIDELYTSNDEWNVRNLLQNCPNNRMI